MFTPSAHATIDYRSFWAFVICFQIYLMWFGILDASNQFVFGLSSSTTCSPSSTSGRTRIEDVDVMSCAELFERACVASSPYFQPSKPPSTASKTIPSIHLVAVHLRPAKPSPCTDLCAAVCSPWHSLSLF